MNNRLHIVVACCALLTMLALLLRIPSLRASTDMELSLPPPPVAEQVAPPHYEDEGTPTLTDWYLLGPSMSELAETRVVRNIVFETVDFFSRHRSVVFAGDSTSRQLMFGVVGFLMYLNEKGVVLLDSGNITIDDAALASLAGGYSESTGWTSERWLEEIMGGCPEDKQGWLDNPALLGGSCAYGSNQMFLSHKGSIANPIVSGVQFNFVDNVGGADVLEGVLSKVGDLKTKPTLLVVNFRTLHLLQLYPLREFESFVVDSQLCDAEKYVEFATQQLEGLLTALEGWGGGRLVYKTTNAVCESKYDGEYAEQMQSWSQKIT